MNWKISLFLSVFIIVASCKEVKEDAPVSLDEDTSDLSYTYANTDHLIEAPQLEKIIGTPNIKLVHFGKEKQYQEGHIPGAITIWRTDIQDASYPYKGMMCSKEQLEQLFSDRGISNKDTLIIYDHVASCDAARLWWILDNYGFEQVQILNGGAAAWKAIQGEFTTHIEPIQKSNFKLPKLAPMGTYVAKEDLLKALQSEIPPVILDARTTDEYTGARIKKGANYGGRIPNSILMDWADCMNYKGDKKFKDYQELTKIFETRIPRKDQAVFAYCHSGVRSALSTFVLTELLGYKNVRNYDGSWTEWTHFKDYPKKQDSLTTIFK